MIMRIALFADIHGNSIALEAVLRDIAELGGADIYWVLGDLAAIGHDPAGVLERLADLPGACFVRGNTDRYLLTGERPPPLPETVAANPGLLPTYTEVAATFAWTLGALSAAGWLDWLAGLPSEQRMTLPNGARLLGVHAAPDDDQSPGLSPAAADEELRARFEGCAADLVAVGHTHWALERRLDGMHLVNVGSVSNPLPPDLRASYVILEVDESGYRVDFRRADYNREAVIDVLNRIRHPGRDFIIQGLRGERLPPWIETKDR